MAEGSLPARSSSPIIAWSELMSVAIWPSPSCLVTLVVPSDEDAVRHREDCAVQTARRNAVLLCFR